MSGETTGQNWAFRCEFVPGLQAAGDKSLFHTCRSADPLPLLPNLGIAYTQVSCLHSFAAEVLYQWS